MHISREVRYNSQRQKKDAYKLPVSVTHLALRVTKLTFKV